MRHTKTKHVNTKVYHHYTSTDKGLPLMNIYHFTSNVPLKQMAANIHFNHNLRKY